MLQRSPTYVLSMPGRDAIAERARAALPAEAAYTIRAGRTSLLTMAHLSTSAAAGRRLARRMLRGGVQQAAAGRLRRRHALQPALRPVGPAPVPRARRRPVRGDLTRQARSSPTASRRSPRTAIGCASGRRAGGRRHRHRDGPEPARPRRRDAHGRRAPRSTSAETVGYKGMMLSGVPNMALHRSATRTRRGR